MLVLDDSDLKLGIVAVDADMNSGQVRRMPILAQQIPLICQVKLGNDHMVLSEEAALGYGSPTVES